MKEAYVLRDCVWETTNTERLSVRIFLVKEKSFFVKFSLPTLSGIFV